MGFTHLRLIDPCDHLSDEAMKLAHGSHHILHSAQVFIDFDSATNDLDLVVCTTSKRRTAKHEYQSSRDLAALLLNKKDQLARVGILFGTEESGLPNQLILKSDMAMSIPMAESYPSLNLAQSVMVTAYELSPLNQLEKPGEALSKSGEGFGTLKKQTKQLLHQAGIPEGTPLFHRILERMATVDANDIPLFLSVLSRIQKTE
jgi:tRNA/rRNA methyltransferase